MSNYLTPIDQWLDAPSKVLRPHAFEAAQFAASQIATFGIQADSARDTIIRLRAVVELRADDMADFKPMIESLTREVGLFPYVDENTALFSDLVARESFRSDSDPDIVFHIEQQRIFDSLMLGNNVVASAPTSFGKSVIIDSIIGQEHIKRCAIIVPTLALLDETRRRLSSKILPDSTIIFHKTQVAPKDGKVIFIGTQERLFDRNDIYNLDILIVDEFYKADPHRSDSRFIILNAAISKFSRISKQFFLIGPFIDGIDTKDWRYTDINFIKTAYKTVSIDPVDAKSSCGNVAALASYLNDEKNLPALIFVKSPKSAGALAHNLVDAGVNFKTEWTENFASWIAKNYTPRWQLVESLNHGIGFHHGQMPRALASTLVLGFNRGKFRVLLCTSTLIEGVNTAAKSVFIWDKQIDGTNVDFFTFANIRGRAGRMGQHYVGKVFYFHSEPVETLTEIQVPGLGEGGDVDEILVHYEPIEITAPAQQRIEDWVSATGLNIADLRRFGSLGFDRIEKLKKAISTLKNDELKLLSWHGYPEYDELKAVCEIIFRVFNLNRSGAYTAKRLTFLVWRLYKEPSLSRFLKSQFDQERPTEPTDLFAFLRTCEFSLPEMMMCLNVSLKRNQHVFADYSLFVARLENWFRPECVKSLEEVGFPIVLFEKMGVPVSDRSSVDEIIASVIKAGIDQRNLSQVEQEMIQDARVR
jgi:hypothetical protein